MFRIILTLAVTIAIATAFRPHVNKARNLKLMAEGEETPHDTYIKGPAPYGKQFFQADIGVPSKDTDFLEVALSVATNMRMHSTTLGLAALTSPKLPIRPK